MRNILILLILSISFSLTAQVDTQTKKFKRMMELLDKYYVDSIDAEKLVEKAIVSMLKELDPHTVYINKDEVESMNAPLKGGFDGIGIQFNIVFDTLMVIMPTSNGPSDKVGIKPGDRIISVEGENIAGIGITTKDVRAKLLGNKGTKVNVGIKRTGVNEILDFTITRDKIPIHSVDASFMMSDKVGYIKISRFSTNTMDEFNKAFLELKEQGLEHLILDLEGNGGGYLNVAVELTDEFLSENKMIVYTEGVKNEKKEKVATKKGKFEKGRLCVVINERSASASEIFSGAIQDWDRGVLVGRRSYGKGLVQRQYRFSDGAATRVTIAHYYTPTGRSIQRPYEDGVDQYRQDLRDRFKKGELSNEDSIPVADSLIYKTLEKQRTVFGGGGILPDVFVPVDTLSLSDYYSDIIRKGILTSFVLTNIDKNREKYMVEYPNFEMFDAGFVVDTVMINELVEIASKEGVPENKEELELSKERLKIQMKALFARDLFEQSNYVEVINRMNPAVIKAFEIISNKKEYKSLLK